MAPIVVGSADRDIKSAVTPGSAKTARLVCNGEYWMVGYDDATFLVRQSKGIAYIQRLLQHPGEEFHALDLLSGTGVAPDTVSTITTHSALMDQPVSFGTLGDAGEMLDPQAKREYARKLVELRQELEELRERSDYEGVERVQSEIDFIAREVSRAVGLGGRDRRAGSIAERARLNVTRSIKVTIQKIAEHHASLGQLLDRSIHTGLFCCYKADPLIQTKWVFSADAAAISGTNSSVPLIRRVEATFVPALSGRTAFVGREAETATLARIIAGAQAGDGRVAMIGGAPGVGKSRLAAEVCLEAVRQGVLVFSGSCYDRADPVPLLPFVEILETALANSSNPESFRDALGSESAEVARLLPQLRRMFPEIPVPFEVPPEQSRRILYTAITNLMLRTAEQSPMLLLLEDLHWADEGTLTLLTHLARALARARVAIIGTYRDEDLDPAAPLAKALDEMARSHVLTRVDLTPLPQNNVAAMLRDLSGGREAPSAIVNFMYSGTGGNPFFVEELFHHLVERNQLLDEAREFRTDFKSADIDIPASLRLLLGRRLNRLGAKARKALGIAAVVGRSFTFELFRAASGIEEDLALDAIEEVEKVGLISASIQNPETLFQFSHELIRQAVLADLSVPRRQRIHAKVAAAIEQLYASRLDAHTDDLAHHLWNAGSYADPRKTASYLVLAGKNAALKSAFEAAIAHFEKALKLLSSISESRERDSFELDLIIEYGVALLAKKGWHDAEFGEIFQRAYQIGRRMEDDARLFPVLSGLWSFKLTMGSHPQARQYADEMVQMAALLHDDGMQVQACWASGCSNLFMGEFIKAHQDFDECVRLYDKTRHRTLAFRYGHDPAMSSLCYDGLILWILGFPDQAEQRLAQSLALARELDHPFTLGWCLVNIGMNRLIRFDFEHVEDTIKESIALSDQYGLLLRGYAARVYAKMARFALQSRLPSRDQDLQKGPRFVATAYELSGTWTRALIADASGNLGHFDFASTLLTEAQEIMERNHERCFEPEIHRMKGEVILKRYPAGMESGPSESELVEAEKHFRIALAQAERSNAKSFELRAATSLSLLLARTGRRAEARTILKAVYDRFTEGFDSRELTEARALLTTLDDANSKPE